MSHNVWERDTNTPEWAAIGEDCSAEARAPGIVRVYKDTLPDIIGFQEATYRMCDLVLEGCKKSGIKYTAIFGGRTPIFYRQDKLELIDSDCTVYPEHIEGLNGEFNNNRTKSFCIGVFRIKESGSVFAFATTHLWWRSEADLQGSDSAREIQLSSLISKLSEIREKYACPAIIVGDLNTGYRSAAVKRALECGYRHAHDIATEYADGTIGYHYCFPDGFKREYRSDPFENAIDHIFVTGETEGAVKRFERWSPEYYFPISDHSAVFADIEL